MFPTPTDCATEAAPTPVPARRPEALATPADGSPLRDLEDGQRVRRRLRGPRARAAAQAQRRALAAALGRRRQRHRRGGLLGGGRGALRALRHRHRGLRQRRLRGQRALGGEDQDRRAARGGAATSTRPRTWPPSREVSLEQLESRPARAAGDGPGPAAARAARPLLRRRARETWARFRDAPAAKVYHQAYRHGLLEHTLSVAQAVSAAANFFPGIDRDVAVTGALLHDIGKTEAYNDDPLAIDLTDAGRLQGEIPLGYYMVRRQIEEIPGFDPALAQCVLHIILSHHGSLEHGSPVVPATREAVLVHMIDNLGGRLGSFDRLERQLPAGESWSGFDRALSGSAYFGQRARRQLTSRRRASRAATRSSTVSGSRWKRTSVTLVISIPASARSSSRRRSRSKAALVPCVA